MEDRHLIYSVPYTFDENDFKKKLSEEKMRKRFLSTNTYGYKRVVRPFIKRALKKGYDIEDTETAMIVISNALLETILQLLIDRHNQGDKQYQESYSINSLIAEVEALKLQPILKELSDDQTALSYQVLYTELVDYHHIDYLLQDKDLINLSNHRYRSAFDCARIIGTIGQCIEVNYLSEETGKEMLEMFGRLVTILFSNWEAFLASYLLGKLSFNRINDPSDVTRTDKEMTNTIYSLITLAESPIQHYPTGWPTEATALRSYLESLGRQTIYSEKSLFKIKDDEALQAFEAIVLPIFEKAQVSDILLNKKKTSFASTIKTYTSKHFSFQEEARHSIGKKIALDEAEYCFISTTSAFFTNKGVYVKVNKELVCFKWTDEWVFHSEMRANNWVSIQIEGNQVLEIKVRKEDIVGKYETFPDIEDSKRYAKDYMQLVETCFNQIKKAYQEN